MTEALERFCGRRHRALRTAAEAAHHALAARAAPLPAADATPVPACPAPGRAGPPAADRLADLLLLVAQWQPDLIVRENADYAGCVAAEARGLPHAVVQNGNVAVLGFLPREPLTERLDALRAAAGLAPDPGLAMPFPYLLLLPVPRSFHDPAVPLPPTARFVRPLAFDRTGDETLPEWIDTLPRQPTVYMTLGTVYNRRADLFATVIAALRDEPVNLIVTVGRDQDPEQFGPQPGTVHIARYIPQSLLLPRCAAMVNMGGMNSVRSACEQGLPLVLFPLVTEQAFTAERWGALGMAQVLDAESLTPAAVREVLAEPSYRRNAERVRDEVAAMPGPEHTRRAARTAGHRAATTGERLRGGSLGGFCSRRRPRVGDLPFPPAQRSGRDPPAPWE